jgi:ABC-2 type transport system ATP-binding protein
VEDVIVVDGLRKTFRTPFRQKKVEAVKSVSFTVGRGEIFGFLGPNGAGKTTTIKVLTGLVRASAGFVSVLGGRPDDIAVKARIGFLPEQPYFYDYLTPRELLDVFGRLFGMPRDRRKRRIGELLEQVGLGYASDRTLRKFSKGMLQRVGIAQALLNDPELVILDEPMSGLDPIGHREVIDLIAALKARGATVFFSSHILADVERLCDRVAVLDRGLMKATGSLDALLGGTSDEKEVVLRGAPAPVADGTWPGLRSVGTIGSGAVRCVVRDVATDAFVSKALEAGLSLVTVTERRMTLEELVVGPVAGQGVAAGA